MSELSFTCTAAAVLIAVCIAGCTGLAGDLSGERETPQGLITPLFLDSQKDAQMIFSPESTLLLPGWLPDGYLCSGGFAGVGEEWYCTLTYSRGPETIILYQRAAEEAMPEGEEVLIGGATGRWTEVNGGEALFWVRDGLHLRISGSPTREEKLKIAGSLLSAPYDPDTIPDYDYAPPARILNTSFSVGETVTDQDIALTLVSLECTPEYAEAVFSVKEPPGVETGRPIPTPPAGVEMPPASPQPEGLFQADSNPPLRTVHAIGYSSSGGRTTFFWRVDPLPADTRVLHIDITSLYGREGRWEFDLPPGGGGDWTENIGFVHPGVSGAVNCAPAEIARIASKDPRVQWLIAEGAEVEGIGYVIHPMARESTKMGCGPAVVFHYLALNISILVDTEEGRARDVVIEVPNGAGIYTNEKGGETIVWEGGSVQLWPEYNPRISELQESADIQGAVPGPAGWPFSFPCINGTGICWPGLFGQAASLIT